MITTLRKAQDSWITKGILILTAMSFMSLFGISGYIDSAAGNRAVIKVNDREINQQEINLQLNDNDGTLRESYMELYPGINAWENLHFFPLVVFE